MILKFKAKDYDEALKEARKLALKNAKKEFQRIKIVKEELRAEVNKDYINQQREMRWKAE